MEGHFCTNLRKLARLPSSGYVTLLPYQTAQVEDLFRRYLPPVSIKTIIDGTAHIGGDALHFSRIYPDASITAIDIDARVIECLKKNITNFAPDPTKYHVVCDDFVAYIKNTHPVVDLIYLDPPWGGPGYSENKELSLYLGGLPLDEVVNYILREKLTTRQGGIVVKVPKNFAYVRFKSSVTGETSLHYVHKLQKNGGVAYGLVFIKARE